MNKTYIKGIGRTNGIDVNNIVSNSMLPLYGVQLKQIMPCSSFSSLKPVSKVIKARTFFLFFSTTL